MRKAQADELQAVAPTLMRTIRQALGVTQGDMADRIGVSRQMVNYYEHGEFYPSVATWMRWTDAAGKIIRERRLNMNVRNREVRYGAQTIPPE